MLSPWKWGRRDWGLKPRTLANHGAWLTLEAAPAQMQRTLRAVVGRRLNFYPPGGGRVSPSSTGAQGTWLLTDLVVLKSSF